MLAQQIKPAKTAGDELIIAKKHFYTGCGFVAIGGLISFLGASASEPAAGFNPALATGGIFALIGSIITLESFSHIGKAGEIMNRKNETSFIIDKDGIGFRFRF